MKLGEKITEEGDEYRLVYGQLDCKGCAFIAGGPKYHLCRKHGATGSKNCLHRINEHQIVFGKFKRVWRYR